ncbi:hypothetical protein GCM10023321_13450 [Pseudonocardia eucalypti]|uniref:Uncharacterized protein n=1 Tax=Pseudonocardia eucalypti TaxID=648755 RepID=A0ABP9PNN4_9PSEU|nr:hypothetical protein [Pseudonocardia eucalypti]
MVLLAGTNLPAPLYGGYQQRFGFSPLVVTLIYATYVGALVPSPLVVGLLSGSWGVYCHVLHDQTGYQDLGPDWNQRRRSAEHRTRKLVHQLEQLGHTVTPGPAA